MSLFEHVFILGAQRCASTYLYHLLDEHPEIEMARPVRPEPKFFLIDSLFTQGIAGYYGQFFAGKPGAWWRGEKATSYIESETVAQRIAQTFPNATLLVLLRDPIERAISNYWFSVQNGVETLPLTEALVREAERRQQYDRQQFSTSPYAYLQRGRYSEYLMVYLRYFAPAQIKIVLYEQLVGSLDQVQALYHWLGVRADVIPASLHRLINESAREESELPEELCDALRRWFADSNQYLIEQFGLDLNCWPSWTMLSASTKDEASL
jgi:hypothetical protein